MTEKIVVSYAADAVKLQLLIDKILGYQEICDRCQDGGNDGGDVADAQDAWNDLLEHAKLYHKG